MRSTTDRAAKVAILAVAALAPVAVCAESIIPSPDSAGLQYALNEFRDTTGLSAAWRRPAINAWLLRSAEHVDLEFGLIHAPGELAATVMLGPVWEWPLREDRSFIDFRFGPLLISRRKFGETDIGGHLQFSSSLSFGFRFGGTRQHALALQIRHVSNGNLDKPNPGLDMIGLRYSSRPD